MKFFLKSKTIIKYLSLAVLSLIFTACVPNADHNGTVIDASTGGALSGVKATLSNFCVNNNSGGCDDKNPESRTTNANGELPKGQYQGGAASGHEAVTIEFSKQGYTTVTKYLTPDYSGTNIADFGTIYLCPSNAEDTDGDGLCNKAEALIGSNANTSDTDGDRISDLAEVYGINGVDLISMGGSVTVPNIYVEVDHYADKPFGLMAQTMVIQAFERKGIDIIIDISDEIAANDEDSDLNPWESDLMVIKNQYFASRRSGIFHYALFADRHSGDDSSGKANIGGDNLVVTLGATSTANPVRQGSTFMHELGHNLYLTHNGPAGTSNSRPKNDNPHHLSIMNYLYQLIGLTVNGQVILDYQSVAVAGFDENALNERFAFAPLNPAEESLLTAYTNIRLKGPAANERYTIVGNANSNLDFDNNGVISNSLRGIDINGDGQKTTFVQADVEWNYLDFSGKGDIGDAALVEEDDNGISSYSRQSIEEDCMDDIGR